MRRSVEHSLYVVALCIVCGCAKETSERAPPSGPRVEDVRVTPAGSSSGRGAATPRELPPRTPRLCFFRPHGLTENAIWFGPNRDGDGASTRLAWEMGKLETSVLDRVKAKGTVEDDEVDVTLSDEDGTHLVAKRIGTGLWRGSLVDAKGGGKPDVACFARPDFARGPGAVWCFEPGATEKDRYSFALRSKEKAYEMEIDFRHGGETERLVAPATKEPVKDIPGFWLKSEHGRVQLATSFHAKGVTYAMGGVKSVGMIELRCLEGAALEAMGGP